MDKAIKNIIEELNKIDNKWQKKVVEVNDLEQLYKSEHGDELGQLIDLIRQFIKSDREEEIKDILSVVDNKKAVDILINYAYDTMVHYNNMFILRELEKENCEEIVFKLIQDAFENCVLRFDYNFIDRYDHYKIKDADEMRNILRSIDCLTEYYVRRLFTKRSICEDFELETGLSKTCCEKYAELVEDNFKEIRMNIIMQDGEYIRQAMS